MRKRAARLSALVLALGALLVLARSYGPYLPVEGLVMSDVSHPRGHDDVVVRVSHGPGMTTLEMAFSTPPTLVVTGDGTAYAARDEDHPGLVQPVVRFGLGEVGLQSLLKRAAHDGLLAEPPTYSSPQVMDGGDTVVDLSASGGTWTHRAYALVPGWAPTARGRLGDFVGAADALAASARASRYRPAALRVMAMPGNSPEPGHEVVPWPTRVDLRLADIGTCRVVTEPAVIRVLTTRPDRYFRDAGTTYEVAAAVLLPGDSCPVAGGS